MSKRKALPLLPKPEFAMTGLAAGAGAGLVAGFIAEWAWHHSLLVIQAGGIVGIAIGATGESLRSLWQRHCSTESCTLRYMNQSETARR